MVPEYAIVSALMDGPVISAFNSALARLSAIDKEITALDAQKLSLQAERAALMMDLDRAREVLAHLTPASASVRLEGVPAIVTVGTMSARTRPIRQSSSVGFTHEVLRIAKRDMHVDEIIDMIWKMHGQRVNRATLVSNLSRYVKAQDTFRRSGPNVYGLIPPAESAEAERLPM